MQRPLAPWRFTQRAAACSMGENFDIFIGKNLKERWLDKRMRMKHLLVPGAGWLAPVTTLLLISLLLALWDAAPALAQTQSGITSPTAGAVITGTIPIIGTAVHERFQKYELAFKLEPSGDDAYVYFTGGTSQVVNSQLGTWPAGGLAPGLYRLRLRVVKNDSNYDEFFVQNLSVNQQAAAPTATPTPSTPTETPPPSLPTETPIPTASFIPAPQLTAVGQVTQPQVEADQAATPTAIVASTVITVGGGPGGAAMSGTALALAPSPNNNARGPANRNNSNLSRQLGEQLSFERLRTRFYTGMRLSAALFLGAFALFAGKRMLAWVWTRYR
jgi:hypothetical protein